MKFISYIVRVFVLVIVFLGFIISCEKEKKDYFDLDILPEDWVRLTKIEGEFVVFNSCDSGNLLLTISKETDKYELLLHGQQEDYRFEILESFRQKDNIIVVAKWKDSNEKQTFKFSWLDKSKGIGRWITTYSNGFISDNIFVVENNQISFKKVDQPCRECWGDECDEKEENITHTDKPIEKIKKIFEDYIHYQESTDSPENKELMAKSIQSLSNVENQEDLELLINVWMYYDPTDFPSRDLVYEVLKKNVQLSIDAVNDRIKNKKEQENKDSAPFSDLEYLLKILKNE